MSDAKLADECGRIAALQRLDVLDSEPEAAFDKITSLVKTILGVPICAVSLVDKDRQWFKSIQGLDARQTPRSAAFCDHTIRTREPLIVPDARADPRFADSPLVTGAPNIASYAGVPLQSSDGYNLGALCAIDTCARTFTDAQIDILRNFASLVCDELELRTIARTDHLTGAMTRRGFTERAEQELARHRRHCRPCSLVVLDVDHFKKINDSHGHPAGDDVLKAVVATCAAELRSTDCLGRMGGEEFAVLLPETGAEDAIACAERLRCAVEAIVMPSLPDAQVTISLGIAAAGETTPCLDDWLAWADAALYAAKRSGRNRHVLADQHRRKDAA
jgi:diguanylate cyclase (GGDEF)-like protein